MNWQPFNINDYVRVKINDRGRKIHKENWDRIVKGRLQYTGPKEDKDGWSRWQLWSLMAEFGEHIHLGFSEQPFSTDIEFESGNDRRLSTAPDAPLVSVAFAQVGTRWNRGPQTH